MLDDVIPIAGSLLDPRKDVVALGGGHLFELLRRSDLPNRVLICTLIRPVRWELNYFAITLYRLSRPLFERAIRTFPPHDVVLRLGRGYVNLCRSIRDPATRCRAMAESW